MESMVSGDADRAAISLLWTSFAAFGGAKDTHSLFDAWMSKLGHQSGTGSRHGSQLGFGVAWMSYFGLQDP